jgi:hypothetical protein
MGLKIKYNSPVSSSNYSNHEKMSIRPVDDIPTEDIIDPAKAPVTAAVQKGMQLKSVRAIVGDVTEALQDIQQFALHVGADIETFGKIKDGVDRHLPSTVILAAHTAEFIEAEKHALRVICERGLSRLAHHVRATQQNVNDLFSGYPLLHWAARSPNPVLVESVLAVPGADINVQHDDSGTALQWAVTDNNLDTIRVLLAAGADVNLPNSNGEVPLHFAAHMKAHMIVRELLQAGANKHVVSHAGVMPIDMTTDEDIKALLA